MESSEEVYSRSIIKNIVDEMSEDIHNFGDYGLCEIYLEAELEVYKKAFPSLNMMLVEDIVREYLYNHNYLEYINIIECECSFDYDENDTMYVKLFNYGGEDYAYSVDVKDMVVDFAKNGVIKGLELLDANTFLGLGDDESIEWCVVKVDYGWDIIDVRLSVYIIREGNEYGRLCQWYGDLVTDDVVGEGVFVGCRFIYK